MATDKTVRKIIQISTTRARFGEEMDLECDRIYALCDDGTLWCVANLYWDDLQGHTPGPETDEWQLIVDVPQVVNPQIYNK